jgi:hypothetical protein
MVRPANLVKAAFLVAAIVGPTWSTASACPFQTTGSLVTGKPSSRSSMFPASRGVREATGKHGRHASVLDARRLPLDEFVNRHFLTYLELKEKP